MPVSDSGNFPALAKEAHRLQPKSILDLGCGWGLPGAMLRQYLDVERGRIKQADWEITIDGVEGFAAYRSPLWYCFNSVTNEDFSLPENLTKYAGYDLVLMIDSFEHLDFQTGVRVLKALREQNKHLIVSCPYGRNYLPQTAVYGNEFERHRCHWLPEQFEAMGANIIHRGICFVASLKRLKQ